MKRFFAITGAALISTLIFAACSTEDSSVNAGPETIMNTVPDQHNIDRKLAYEELAGMHSSAKGSESVQSHIDYTLYYDGDLSPDAAMAGDATNSGGRDYTNFAFYTFAATDGSVVTIDVARVDCDFDPEVSLYRGTSETLLGFTKTRGSAGMTWLTRNDERDDNEFPACGSQCGLNSQITWNITETGTYTIAVYKVGTCSGVDDTAFEVTVTGSDDRVEDADGDGVPDDEDDYVNSDTSPIVNIDGCDSEVENEHLGSGAFMMDKLNDCAEDAANHGAYVSCVTDLVNGWKQDGIIAANEKNKITNCASGASIP